MLEQMISISNSGADIASTNYFQTKRAISGLLYLSWNASAARILVPENKLSELSEMCTGKICVISHGKYEGVDGLELLFDDGSDAPYVIQIGMGSVDRAIKHDNKPFIVSAWSKAGKLAEWPGKYRVVKNLPWEPLI